MSERLSSAKGRYTVALYCARSAPFCHHGAPLDIGATISRHGDMTLQTLRERARCGKCGHLGATIRIAPLWTGPADLDPTGF